MGHRRHGYVRWAEDKELPWTIEADLPAREWDGKVVRRLRLAAD